MLYQVTHKGKDKAWLQTLFFWFPPFCLLFSTLWSVLSWCMFCSQEKIIALMSYTKCLSESLLPPFSLICDFGKQNISRNVSKISINLTCYRHVGSKFTNHSPLAWRREGQKITLVAVIGGFRSDMSITRKTGNVSAGVLFSKVVNQRKRW